MDEISTPELQGAELTAVGIALIRAGETSRDDRLFADPYAGIFARFAPGAYARERSCAAKGGGFASAGRDFATWAVLRTAFLDDYLERVCASGCRQIVLLGAGLDSRAYRLAWPAEVELFEVDRSNVLSFKHGVLDLAHALPRCRRSAVPADLRQPLSRILLEAGYRSAHGTVWVAEGLLNYLGPAFADRLLREVGELSSPGDRIAVEVEPDRQQPVGSALKGWGWDTRVYEAGELASRYARIEPQAQCAVLLTAELGTAGNANEPGFPAAEAGKPGSDGVR